MTLSTAAGGAWTWDCARLLLLLLWLMLLRWLRHLLLLRVLLRLWVWCT